MNDTLNQEAIDHPQVGDYWTERVFCPYFLVVKVDGFKITILDAFDRIIHKDTWEFDYSKHKVVDREWMKSKVTYQHSSGFVANVIRRERYLGIVDKWKQFHRNRITKELDEFL